MKNNAASNEIRNLATCMSNEHTEVTDKETIRDIN